jgi:hypothetical protein
MPFRWLTEDFQISFLVKGTVLILEPVPDVNYLVFPFPSNIRII